MISTEDIGAILKGIWSSTMSTLFYPSYRIDPKGGQLILINLPYPHSLRHSSQRPFKLPIYRGLLHLQLLEWYRWCQSRWNTCCFMEKRNRTSLNRHSCGPFGEKKKTVGILMMNRNQRWILRMVFWDLCLNIALWLGGVM